MSSKEKFNCKKQKCTSSCCGAFNGISDSMIPIGTRKFYDIILTPKDLEHLHNSHFKDFIYIAEDGIGRVKTAEDGTCQAFKAGKCLLNKFKPTICQCFPLYLDIFIGLCAIKNCPSVTEDHTIESFTSELEKLIEMSEFWLTHYKQTLKKRYDEKLSKQYKKMNI